MAKSKEDFATALASFLPRKIILSKIYDPQHEISERLKVVLLFADISGFTAMSERLTRLGKAGAEEVNSIINRFFDPLIKIVYKWNGDIYRFGGDAFLVFFLAKEGTSLASEWAICAAQEILTFVKTHAQTTTRVGKFRIKVHLALTKGEVYFQDLTNNFFLGGKAINYLMRIIDLAGPGQIVVSAEIKNDLNNVVFKPKKGGWQYVRTKRRILEPVVHPEIEVSGIRKITPALENYLPQWLLKRIAHKPSFGPQDGEHRKIAIVFLHFSGIDYEHNLRDARTKLTKLYKIVHTTAERYDGWINAIDSYKDSERFLVVFGFPNAYEDDEKRAVLFCYEILHHPELKNFNLRAGVNSGSIFAAPVGNYLRREYATLGDAVNLSARLGAKAKDRTIVVSEPIFNKTYNLFEYIPLGAKEYKGKKKKIRTYQLVAKKTIEAKTLGRWLRESAQIVGRAREIAIVKNVIAHCRSGKGQILCITGEPGVGKSRLVQEGIKYAENANYQILRGNCFSYESVSSYHPWIDVLNEFFQILPEDPVELRIAKVQKQIEIMDKGLVNWLPLLGEILGIDFPQNKLTKHFDPKLKKQRVFDIIFELLKSLAQQKPLQVVIEDLHWADNPSIELINYIARNIQDIPILFTLVYRPLKNKEEFMEKEWSRIINLNELDKDASLQLVRNLLNIKEIPEDLQKIIINKSQGNPFYIEELIKSLIEQGYIVEGRGGWRFRGDIKKLVLPDSVEAVILSRIDRLDLDDRDVLQVASVLGREFDEFLLKGIYGSQRFLKKSLSNLERFDLIRQQKGGRQVKYFFKHILTQEVAYGTLSFARKKELHNRIGEFVEQMLKERKEEFLGLLSYHFYQAENYEKALIYSFEAGEKARKVYANAEAIEFFTRAIASFEKLEGRLK